MQEIDNTRVDDTTGMALVGTIFLIGLLIMFRSLRARRIRVSERIRISIGNLLDLSIQNVIDIEN
jgi:hypothetical protein